MDIRQLKYFESIARNKNFTKAAEELFISQPSLSNMIKKMEKDFGFTLIERTTREVLLTEMGEVLFDHAKKILDMHSITLKEMDEIKNIGKGEIHVGIIESSRFWLPSIMHSFSNEYPNVKINLRNIIRSKEIIEALKSYDIHFAITVNEIQDPAVACYPIFNEEFVLLTNKDHSLNEKTMIDLIEIENENFIQYPTEYQIQQVFLQACNQTNITPNGMYVVDDLELACSLVEFGLGVTVIPESYLKFSPQRMAKLHKIKINNPTPKRKVYVSLMKNRYLPPTVIDLLQLFKRLSVLD